VVVVEVVLDALAEALFLGEADVVGPVVAVEDVQALLLPEVGDDRFPRFVPRRPRRSRLVPEPGFQSTLWRFQKRP